jgi:aldose 1-epimerase
VLFSCNQKKEDSEKSAIKSGKLDTVSDNLKSKIDSKQFETVTNGKLTKLYVLKNKNGLEATFTNFGQRLVSLVVPDKHGSKVKLGDKVDNS